MVLFSPRKAPLCANSVSCINNLSGEKEASNQGVFMGQTVTAPELPDKQVLAQNPTPDVLGVQSNDSKRIYVDLTNQRLYAFDGNTIFMNVPVSTGKWSLTPTGTFRIWIWLKYTRMTGGSGADYYDLPNVPYTMYFYNNSISKTGGYSLHGAYWHNNFGHPMSHGCVNMRIEDAQKLFYWTNPNAGSVTYPTAENPGTLITVYGTTPRE
jgi:lipoprotein-anchoring transpeptidase ErfK/SrfK